MAGRTKSLKVLLVEDGADVARVIEVGLIKAGFRVDWVTSGEEALNRVNNGGIGLVLLDVGLPGIDGHTVCRRIRSHPTRSKLPIIMLTSLSDEEDIVVGLETGADDYVTKPFSAVELVARVQAIMHASCYHTLQPVLRTMGWAGMNYGAFRCRAATPYP